MYILEEFEIPPLKDSLKGVSSLEDFKSITQQHYNIVLPLLYNECGHYEDPIRYLDLKEYLQTIESFLKYI